MGSALTRAVAHVHRPARLPPHCGTLVVYFLQDHNEQLWNSDHGHVLEARKDSLKKLQLDYLDLYLFTSR